MPVSTIAFFMPGFGPYGQGGAGNVLNAYASQLAPEGMPSWIWGQGTPGAFPPFTTINKGSLYSEVNAADDVAANLWVKLDEGGDAADWVELGNTGLTTVKSDLFDISAAASEQVLFHAIGACEILTCGIIWNEATGASGAAEGDITVGTTTGGAEVVAATSYTVSQATGAYVALTLVEGTLAAGDEVFVSHDQASGAAGTYFFQMEVRYEA